MSLHKVDWTKNSKNENPDNQNVSSFWVCSQFLRGIPAGPVALNLTVFALLMSAAGQVDYPAILLWDLHHCTRHTAAENNSAA